ncbi:hypothetical protein [Streptomyces sp. NPDC048411]|uniref:hypothetical protein n=1 Tax=Streptomyces sp. NPDC048411 TaxID=3157206 RepID=UPI003451A36C
MPWYDFESRAGTPTVRMHHGFFQLGGVAGLEVTRVGRLGTATNLPAQLRRRTGLTPTEYRRRFTLKY